VVKQGGAYIADKLKGGGLRRRQGAGVGQVGFSSLPFHMPQS
jgi:hypothetical protein